jgi:hypothetical protein
MPSKKDKPQKAVEYKPCSIKVLPRDKWIDAATTAAKLNPMNSPAVGHFARATRGEAISKERLAVLHTKYWGIKGVKLTVGFLDPASSALKKKILSHMNAWGRFCNVKFTLSSVKPQVRISFSTPPPDDGYWSYLGTDILHIKAGEPTMNLDSFSMDTPDSEFFRVVRHETGHTLGFPHEHFREEIIKRMDRDKTIALFMATQGWSREEVIDQVLTPIPNSAMDATAKADPKSIMCYSLPGSIMKDGKPVPGGSNIDSKDAKFVALIYPKKKK